VSGYAFHPDAFVDLDEIWEYIAQNNGDAADRVVADIHSTSPRSPNHHRSDIDART